MGHVDCHKAHQIYCSNFRTALICISEKLLQTSPLNEQFVHLPGVSPSHSNMFLPPLACLLARMAGQGELVEGWQMMTAPLLQAILSRLLVWKELSTNVTKTHFYLFDMLAVRYQSLPEDTRIPNQLTDVFQWESRNYHLADIEEFSLLETLW